jgi:hypothetical protein
MFYLTLQYDINMGIINTFYTAGDGYGSGIGSGFRGDGYGYGEKYENVSFAPQENERGDGDSFGFDHLLFYKFLT